MQRSRVGVNTTKVVGRLHADDIEAEQAAEAERQRAAAEAAAQAKAAEEAHQRRVAKAVEVALSYTADADIRKLPAEYRDPDDVTGDAASCRRIDAIVEPLIGDRDLLVAEFDKQVKVFGRTTLRAVEPILEASEVAEATVDDADAIRVSLEGAKASLASGLELARLRRRRARTNQIIDLLTRVRAWDEKVAHVRELVHLQRFGEAAASLSLRAYSSNGSPLRPHKAFFDGGGAIDLAADEGTFYVGGDERGFAGSPSSPLAGGGDEHGLPHVSSEIIEAAGEDMLGTIIGAAALRRWLTMSDGNNPYILDHIRRVACRLIVTKRVLDAFSCFRRDREHHHHKHAAAAAAAAAAALEAEDAAGDAGPANSSSSAHAEPLPLSSDGAGSSSDADADDASRAGSSGLDWGSDDESDPHRPAGGNTTARGGGGAAASAARRAKKHLEKSAVPAAAEVDASRLRSLEEIFAEEPSAADLVEDAATLDAVVDGLRALHFSPASFMRFFADSFQLSLDFVLHQTLVDTLGEDAKPTWEAIVDTLVPSELKRTTTNFVTVMAALVRSVHHLRRHAQEVIAAKGAEAASAAAAAAEEAAKTEKHDAPAGNDDEEEETAVAKPKPAARRLWARAIKTATSEVKEGAIPHGNLLNLHTVAVQKCMASLMAFASRVPLSRADVPETLDFFRIMFDFIADSEPLSDDTSPAGARGAILNVLQERLQTYFATALSPDIGRLMFAESFTPFQANHDDFAALDMLMPPEAGRGLADDSTGSVGSLLDSVSIFTFTSLKVCQRMLELARAVRLCPAAAQAVAPLIVSLGAQYVWFVVTHVAASTASVALYDDTNVKEGVRESARHVEASAFALGTPDSYPTFTGAPCHAWKNSAGDPAALYAARERSTALASLEAVVQTQNLCQKSISLLLDATALDRTTTDMQYVATVATFCTQFGFRRLSLNLCSPEVMAAAIDKTKWDEKQAMGGEGSTLTRYARETFFALHDRLKLLGREQGSARPIERILQWVVYNLCYGIVEGAARVRRWSDSGRHAFHRDAMHVTKMLKGAVPATTAGLVEWVHRYTAALAADSGTGATPELYQTHHALYTEKQLTALGDREGFTKRRELAGLLQKLGHVDKQPYSLVDTRV